SSIETESSTSSSVTSSRRARASFNRFILTFVASPSGGQPLLAGVACAKRKLPARTAAQEIRSGRRNRRIGAGLRPESITDASYGPPLWQASHPMSATTPANASVQATESPARWAALFKIAVGILLAMSLWFSASAVSPALREEWSLSPSALAWLTLA